MCDVCNVCSGCHLACVCRHLTLRLLSFDIDDHVTNLEPQNVVYLFCVGICGNVCWNTSIVSCGWSVGFLMGVLQIFCDGVYL